VGRPLRSAAAGRKTVFPATAGRSGRLLRGGVRAVCALVMKSVVSTILLSALSTAAAFAQEKPKAAEDWVYLDNGRLRLGVLRSSGAAIAFLAKSGSEKNLLNHYDRGRLVQQSYYGDADASRWAQREWRYNPVQGGDWQGKSARVLELRHDAATLYAKTVPLHWATGAELPECLMEQWITLRESMVQVRYQFTYHGKATHAPQHQEIPAVFVDASLATLVTYTGSAPWTGAALSRRTPGAANEYLKLDENWAAYVNAQDEGVGIYVPKAAEATCYRFQGGAGSSCSYVAPIATFALKPGLKFTYDAHLTAGTLEEMRAQFTKLSRQPPQK
jgi:hypothetical protein